jgi:hypothetical protein
MTRKEPISGNRRGFAREKWLQRLAAHQMADHPLGSGCWLVVATLHSHGSSWMLEHDGLTERVEVDSVSPGRYKRERLWYVTSTLAGCPRPSPLSLPRTGERRADPICH